MLSVRSPAVFWLVMAFGSLSGATAKAQAPTFRRDQLSAARLSEARAQARRGDCLGALEVFDAALRSSIDATLRRDRGLCHERLGNVYPAIDDFRAYLTASPNAPDAVDIRRRLTRLEARIGEAARSEPVALNVASVSSSRPVDTLREEAEDPEIPLRRGQRGTAIGFFVGARRWFATDQMVGDWSQQLGLRLHVVLARHHTFLAEVGYERFSAPDNLNASLAGLATYVGWEGRLFLGQKGFDDQLALGVGVGYDHLLSTARVAFGADSSTYGAVMPRLRFGYRHNFTRSVGIEATLDGGMGRFFTYTSGGSGVTSYFMGLQVGMVFGL
jgi:hypothetical protein